MLPLPSNFFKPLKPNFTCSPHLSIIYTFLVAHILKISAIKATAQCYDLALLETALKVPMVAVASSLQMSHELGFLKNHKHAHNLKQLDVLSFRFMDDANRPSYSVPSRYNVFLCQSSMVPIRASEISILKTASTVLSRSCNAFHGHPFVLQLASGLIIIVFAIWGLAPLARFGRSLFFKQSDSSWKRTGAHYFTTSYLRPLLLWTGATLVCRALDPMVLSSEASQLVKRRLLVFVRSLSTVLAFAYCLSSLVQQTQQFLVESSDSNDSTNMGFQFAGKAIYSAVWVAAVSLFMELLGFSTQRMLTAGGLGTVLLTLAGREIFTNFLSSLMIHATRPFVLNEWIQTKIEGYEVSGTVEHVGWWSPTIIRGDDREAVHIPNHKFTVNVVRNLSQKTHWRIKTYFFISHLDVNKINQIVADMRKVLAKNPQIEQQRLHRRVFLERIDPENQALVILVSCFVKTSHFEEYLCVKEAVLFDLLRVISHHGARLATPIRTMHKMQNDDDMENIPFSETVFTRARAAMKRSLLLIEPSYKINGEDKIKTQNHSTHSKEDQDTKDASTMASDSTTAVPDLKADTHLGKEAFSSEADDEISTMSRSEFDDTTVSTTSSQSPSKLNSKRMSESMVNNALDSCKEDSKVLAASLGLGSANHGSANSGDDRQIRKDDVPVTEISAGSSSKPELEDLDPVGFSSRDTTGLNRVSKKSQILLSDDDSREVQEASLATLKVNTETEKLPIPSSTQPRSSLEDNIVLGVALEGSKRTLPIEEGVSSSAPLAEMRELTACGNGSGSSSAAEDKKENHTLAFPGDP